MSTLDDDFLDKIIYSPEYQANFKKFTEDLTHKFKREVTDLILFFLSLITFIILIDIPNDPALLLGMAVFAFIILAPSFYSINRLHKDLNSKKLDIKADIFVKLIVEQTVYGTKYSGLFEETGKMAIPTAIIGRFAQNSKVYIVRTSYTKTLLDIIPADKIDHQT